MTAQSRTDTLRRRLQARQNALGVHSPLHPHSDFAAVHGYSSEASPAGHSSPAPESELCREVSFHSDEKFELEFAWIYGWLGKSTGAANVALEWNVQKSLFEVVVRSARECTTVPVEGDVRVNVDHRVVRIGLQDRTVHLRFLTLCDSCRFTALLLQELPLAVESVRTVSTEKLFMWADYVPACSNHKQLCRKGEILWAFWIALSAIWAVVKLSRMIPVEVWQGWMTALHDIIASISKGVLDFCGVPFSQTILDWADAIAASLLSAVNFLVPVHFILPIEAWLISLWNVAKALSFQRLAELASWMASSVAHVLSVFRPVQRSLGQLWEGISAMGSVLGNFLATFYPIFTFILAPFNLLIALSANMFRLVQAVTMEQVPTLCRPLLNLFATVATLLGPMARRVSDAAQLPLLAVGRIGGSNVASAGSTAARFSVGLMCELGGTVWRHVKAAFVETVRLCFQKLEAHVDRGLAINTTDRTPSPIARSPSTPVLPSLSPLSAPVLRASSAVDGLGAGVMSERSPSPLLEIRRSLGTPGRLEWELARAGSARDALRHHGLGKRPALPGRSSRGMAGAAGRALWAAELRERWNHLPHVSEHDCVPAPPRLHPRAEAEEEPGKRQGAAGHEDEEQQAQGGTEGETGWVVVGSCRKQGSKKRERASKELEAERAAVGKRRVSRRRR